jgi:hypothetical protein
MDWNCSRRVLYGVWEMEIKFAYGVTLGSQGPIPSNLFLVRATVDYVASLP